MPKKTEAVLQAELRDIRKYLALGLTHDEIISSIAGLSRATFYRYMKRIYYEDQQQMIMEGDYNTLPHVILMAKNGMKRSLRNLRTISLDTAMHARDRIDAELLLTSITSSLLKLEAEQSTIALNKELRSIEHSIQQRPQLAGQVGPIVRYSDLDGVNIQQQDSDNPRSTQLTGEHRGRSEAREAASESDQGEYTDRGAEEEIY